VAHGQVHDVDVVADARPVDGLVVAAVDLQLRATSDSNLEAVFFKSEPGVNFLATLQFALIRHENPLKTALLGSMLCSRQI
jgi:hypothetical protein